MVSPNLARPSACLGAALLAWLCLVTAPRAEAQDVPLQVDESFTLYTIANQREQGSGAERWTLWTLESRLRVLVPAGQTLTPGSILRFEVRRGDTRIGGARCRTNLLEMAGAPVIIVLGCQAQDSVRESGELTVTWFFVDGANDAERQIAQHTIVVRELPVLNRGVPPTPGAPHMILDRHSEALSSFIIEDPSVTGLHPAGLFGERFTAGPGMILTFHTSPEGDEGLHSVTLRCRVDGQLVELANNRIQHWSTDEQYQNAWEAVPGATTTVDSVREQYVRFYRYAVLLPLTIGGGPNLTRVTDGTWECDLRTATAETLRTFRFRVAEGRVVAHAEETEGGLVLGPGIHLAETVIPAEHPLDDRTDPSALARAFYGRGFRSAAGRAFTIARIGEPYPAARGAGRGGASRGGAGRSRR